MDKTVLMMMGKSGSGKSTLERALVDNYSDRFHKVVSVTTRPKRQGEVDGRDYHFITDQQFDQLEYSGKLIQKTEFAGNRYGSTHDEYATDHPYAILVVVPNIAASFTPVLREHFPEIEILYVWFNISNQRLRQNMRERGDTDEQIEQRLDNDLLDVEMKNTEIEPNYIINDDMLDLNLHRRFDSLLRARELRKQFERQEMEG